MDKKNKKPDDAEDNVGLGPLELALTHFSKVNTANDEDLSEDQIKIRRNAFLKAREAVTNIGFDNLDFFNNHHLEATGLFIASYIRLDAPMKARLLDIRAEVESVLSKLRDLDNDANIRERLFEKSSNGSYTRISSSLTLLAKREDLKLHQQTPRFEGSRAKDRGWGY